MDKHLTKVSTKDNRITLNCNFLKNDSFPTYDNVQDRGHKIVPFENKIHGVFNIKVVKL